MYDIMLEVEGEVDALDSAESYGEAVGLVASYQADMPESAHVYIEEE